MKTQNKIKRLKIIGTVWIVSYCIFLLVGIFAMWRYEGFSGLLNAWSSFPLIFKLIIPALVLFCFTILLVPGFSYLEWASILENPPDKLLAEEPFGRFFLIMLSLTPLIIFITVIIDINIIFIYSLMGLASNIGIWNTVCLNGLINFVCVIVYLIIDSKRRQQKD